MSRCVRRCFRSVVSILATASIVTFIATIAPARTAVAQGSGDRIFRPVPVEHLMTAEERQATGVMRLTPAERRELAAWVARRTAASVAADRDAVRRAAWTRGGSRRVHPATWAESASSRPASNRPASSEPARSARAPADSVSAPVRVSLVPAATIFAWPVIAVREGGRFVDLSDGTSWEVAPADRPVAAAWEEGQPVTVGRIGAPTAGAADSPTDGFEHSLTNAEAYRNGQAMRTVAVRFAGRAP